MHRFVHAVDKVIFLNGDDVRRAPMAAALLRRCVKRGSGLQLLDEYPVLSTGSGQFTEEAAPADYKA